MEQPSPPAGLPVTDAPPPPDDAAGGPRDWRWWQALGGLFGALAGASVAGLIVFGIAAIFGGDATNPTGGMNMAALAVQDVCFAGAAVLLASTRGARPATWMFGLREPRGGWARTAGLVLLAYGAFLAFSAVWSLLVKVEGQQLTDDLGVKANDIAAIGGAVLVCVLAPIGEEMLFRGLVFPALRGSMGTWPAALATGALFGGVHVIGSPVGALFPLALFGTLLCWMYLRTGSLLPGIALHALNNSVAYGSLVDWTWQVPIALVLALAILFGVYRATIALFGAAPAHLASV